MKKMNQTSGKLCLIASLRLIARKRLADILEKTFSEQTARLLRIASLLLIALIPSQADAQVCATPGKDGAGGTLSGVINTYYPGTASAAAGATSITLGAARGSSTAIASGDLLLVIQMQDATINSNNDSTYGDGASGDPACGYMNGNNTGRYEFVKASGAVPITGGTVTIQGAGASDGLLNSYTNDNATPSQGQRRFQVVRVPQYTTATLSSTLTAAAWDGATGGILALDASRDVTMGGTVSVSGLGFRPGGALQLIGGTGSSADYRSLATSNFHGSKGEGIAGTPRYMYNSAGNSITDTGVEGYPNGSSAQGGPGNAGGGGTDGNPSSNDQNPGGGGGGNGGGGGRGGNTWFSNLVAGGFGGGVFIQSAVDRLVIGGGGGAGTRNNDDGITEASSGGAGGGIVIIRAGSMTGSGAINADGADAFNDTLNDGGGGGGAGGSVLIWVYSGSLSGLTVNARGGRGGDAWHNQAASGYPGERHGPGGGGGGGVVKLSTTAAGINVNGGANGVTTTAADAYGATPGAAGTGATNITGTQIPGVGGGATCDSPSEVQMHSFEATGFDRGTYLQWQTGFEVNNLGFNLYRDEGGKRALVNPQLLAGSALLAGADTALRSGQVYSWWDGAAQAKSGAQYWLEDVDLNGQSTWHGPYFAKVVAGAPPERSDAAFLSKLGAIQSQAGFTEPIDRQSPLLRMTSAQISVQSTLAGQPAVKISVRREGFYRVSAPELQSAGLDPKVDPRLLQLYADASQVPINVTTDKNGLSAIEFYGRGVDAAYTDVRVYWLIAGTQPGLRMEQVKEDGPPAYAQSFFYTVQRKDRTIYFSGLRNGDRENFFGAVIARAPVDQSLTLQHVDQSASGQARLKVALQGVTTLPHQVWVYLNGQFAGEVSFNGQSQGVADLPVQQHLLREGDNQVTLAPQGGPSDVSLVDYASISYFRSFMADNDSLRFTAAEKQAVTVGGFTKGSIRVLDVTNPDAVQEVFGRIEKQKESYQVTVTPAGTGQRRLLAITDNQASSPAKLAANVPSSLRKTSHAASLVIITSRDFALSAEPLKRARASQGFTVETVDVEDIFDEFSFGNKTPQAVKDFLQYSTAKWKVSPQAVLMVGDASLDPKNYLGFGDSDLVPTKLIDTQLMEATSDDWFADSDDDGVAELAVGRLPVRTTEEAARMISKIVGYDQSRPSESVLLVADKNDGVNFEAASRQLRTLVPQTLRVDQINRGGMDIATARKQLMDAIEKGQRIVNYMGHGSVNLWAGNLLTNEDAAGMRNRDHLPLFAMMTCLNGYFQDAGLDSLAEVLMKSEGGAVAVWASSGMTTPNLQAVMNQQAFRLLFAAVKGKDKPLTLGEVTRRAKAAINDSDIRRTWILLGDPTMRLR